MRTQAVHQRQSLLYPMAEGALVGAAAGYAVKYAQPLTPQELNDPVYKQVIASIKRKNASKELKGIARDWTASYNLVTKHSRPTALFLIAGAIVGAMAGLLGKIIKTDIEEV